MSRGTTIVIAGAALAIAIGFAAVTLGVTRPLGLPLDDSYIYLTYAKQIGRGEPFSYFPGGGYSAGATSPLWPWVLAPFWTVGARGHALVWVSYVLCAAGFALTALGVDRVVRRLGAGPAAGACAALVTLGIAPFAWTALSGMEVALASALLVTLLALVIEQDPEAPPARRLSIVMAAAALARPEGMALVFAIACAFAVRNRRAALRWLAPLGAPLAWLIANRAFAGTWLPNTGVAKSYFYLPGFDWTYWFETVWATTGAMLRGLFWSDASPLGAPRLVAVLWIVGALRIARWARRERRYVAGAAVIAAPLLLVEAVVASSGLWSFQNFRYIAPAFPLLAIGAGVALGPRREEPATPLGAMLAGAAVVTVLVAAAPVVGGNLVAWLCALAPFLLLAPWPLARAAVLAVGLGLVSAQAVGNLGDDARLFAQGALDTNTQVVAIGEYLHRELPDARVMFHDAGAIAYYGDTAVYDMLGLVTNHQARVANHGPGARFEMLERLPAGERPTHFAYYPSWLGTRELFGEVLLRTPLRPRLKGLAKSPLVGDADMQVIAADWDHLGTGEQPLAVPAGWRVVDRVDVADLASERAHAWRGGLGRRATGDPTARWSLVGSEVRDIGLVLDGGRTIRDGETGERFELAVDPTTPVKLVMRTGGQPSYPHHDAIRAPVGIEVAGVRATLPVPAGPFVEVTFDLPPGVREIAVRAAGPYRVFHWFALQR